MHITVSGKHLDVGDALRSHVESALAEATQKYFDRPVDATVVFARDGHGFKCDAAVHLPTGLTAKAEAVKDEIYAAFEASAGKIEKQLRRHKRRLKDHHQRRKDPVEAFAAQAYVLRVDDDAEEAPEPSEPSGSEPVIVAEMEHSISHLSVTEAVMQMELGHAPFVVFKNDANGRLNIVFRRDDGNIGWIDPANLHD